MTGRVKTGRAGRTGWAAALFLWAAAGLLPGGATALYDSLVEALQSLEDAGGPAVLVLFTDGLVELFQRDVEAEMPGVAGDPLGHAFGRAHVRAVEHGERHAFSVADGCRDFLGDLFDGALIDR